MAILTLGAHTFDADLVVFDKDGTLIEFANLWGERTQESVLHLVHALGGDDRLTADLYHALAYDPIRQQFTRPGPVLTATMTELYTVVATVLFQHGLGWLEAVLRVEEHFIPAMNAPVEPGTLQATADLPALFGALTQAGVHIAVVTSDDHLPTAQTLDQLEVAHHVGILIGADDGYPAKPAPQGLLAACTHFGVSPSRVVMVGDSTTDMVMAQRAGVGCRVAVLTGGMDRDQLTPSAHLVLESIREIRVNGFG